MPARRRRRSGRAEFRDFLVRGCAGAGLFVALIYGAHHVPKASTCPAHHAAGCASKGLSEVLVKWGLILGVGAVVGLVVGLLLVSLIPKAKPQPRTRASRAAIPERVRHAVWRRDEGRCVECGSKEHLEFDHIIPLSRGGSNTERNLQLLCAQCNGRKAAHV